MVELEKEFELAELKKRFDILVYDQAHHPWMMIECKAMDIALNEDVLQQVLRYNISVPVRYLVITNGKHCFGWLRQEGRLAGIDSIPELVT